MKITDVYKFECHARKFDEGGMVGLGEDSSVLLFSL